MTQAKNRPDSTDDMLPEYDFSKMGKPVRGKYAQRIRENGYSVTVNHEDGTSTTTHITPEEIAQRRGEEISTSKVIGDVVALKEDLPQHNLLAGQVGTIVETLAPEVYEVEFSDDDGQTYAMLPLHSQQLLQLKYQLKVSA
jgi:Domain of unknown function (DUF4926)